MYFEEKPRVRNFMSEKQLSRNVVRSFPGKITRIENRAQTGTPDLNYLVRKNSHAGWIELKIGKVTSKGNLTFSRFTQSQVVWLADYARHGGNAFLLTRVHFHNNEPSIYTLHHGSQYKLLNKAKCGTVMADQFIDEAVWSGTKLDVAEIAHQYL